VEPGGVLEVRLTALASVASASVASATATDPGRPVPLAPEDAAEAEDGALAGAFFGKLVGALEIAPDAPDGVHRVTLTGTFDDGSSFRAEADFRVVAR